MKAEVSAFLQEETKKLIAAGSCCEEAKAAGEAYLAAVGTNQEAEAAKALIAELKEDVGDLDETLAWAQTDDAKQVLGEEYAAGLVEGLKASKAAGGKYCICPACTAGGAILDRENEIIGE